MDRQNSVLAATALTAAAAVVSLSVAQTDAFSRKFLSPERLQAKRQQEYAYRWEQSVEKALLRAHIFLAGGVNAHGAAVQLQQLGVIGNNNNNNNNNQQQLPTSRIWDETGLKDLITEWIQQDKQLEKESKKSATTSPSEGPASSSSSSATLSPFPQILGISREEESRELLLELYNSKSGTYELPLIRFGMVLADMLEATITTTALCFVADASSGLSSQFLANMLETSKVGVAIIREPCWMTAFAKIAAERVISVEKQQRILFGLCRMEALRVREQVGEARTVVFTIPGQSVVPVMLPLLQAAFPEDRHVFAYDSCVASIERGVALRKQYRRATVPASLEDALSFAGDASSSDPTRHTTPLSSSLTKSVLNLAPALQDLRLYHADIVQSWMGSVDAFFKLKEEENSNGYLPYTFKIGLLVGNPSGSLEPESDRYYSLSSLLQFITGCRSRPLPEGVLDAAREWLRDFAYEHAKTIEAYPHLTAAERKAVENCAFRHKSILIQDKTLKDTVLPTKHWTLKQAVRKGGCACCAPEEDDEDEELQTSKFANSSTGISRYDSRSTDSDVGVGPTRTNFVDGKASFAFDPSKFSEPAPAPVPSRPTYVDGKNAFAFDPSKFS